MINVTNLPKNATDGMEVCDIYGSIWKYNKYTNSWINTGTISDSLVVSELQNGLVSTSIATRLSAISNAVNGGLTFDYLKIYPHSSGYYYAFKSSNNTILFEPESAHDLRIEVSRPRLLSLISQLRCPGAQGIPGIYGDKGLSGAPGAPEERHIAVIDGSILLINTIVNNSLGTPISLRIFAGDSNIPAIIVRITADDFQIVSGQIDIDYSATFFDYIDGILLGQIKSVKWGTTPWTFKASQMGRKGAAGEDGSNFIVVQRDEVSDSNLASNEAIITMRCGDRANTINYFVDSLFDANCVSKLAIGRSCEIISTPPATTYAAVQVTTNTCKKISKYNLDYNNADAPRLLFSEWTPIKTCLYPQYADDTRLQWIDYTKVGSGVVSWRKANKIVADSPEYPWGIMIPTQPGQMCCQEDFFFCQNVNDASNARSIDVISKLRPQPTSDIGCICDCPISFLLAGGYKFDDVVIRNIGDLTTQSAVCSVNGTPHTYSITVKANNNFPICAIVTWTLSYDDICDESRSLMPDNQLISEFSCPIRWSIADRSIETNMLFRRFGDQYQTLSTIGAQSHVFNITSGSIAITTTINESGLDCCLGYKLAVSVSSVDCNTFSDSDFNSIIGPAYVTPDSPTIIDIYYPPSMSPSYSPLPYSVSPSLAPLLSRSPSILLYPSSSPSINVLLPSLSPSNGGILRSLSPSLERLSLSPSSNALTSLSPSLLSPSISPSLTRPSQSVSISPSLAWPSQSPSISPSLARPSQSVSPSLARPSQSVSPSLLSRSISPSLAPPSLSPSLSPSLEPAVTSFDWRWQPSGNYVTSIRNQGSCGSCWAHGTTAALEIKWAIEHNILNPTMKLSPQHLLCSRCCEANSNGCVSGYDSFATNFFMTDGVVTETDLPYTASLSSPYWPLTGIHQYYKLSSATFGFNANTKALQYLRSSPLVALLESPLDYYHPSVPPTGMQTLADREISYDVPDYISHGTLPPIASGASGDDSYVNHCVCIIGYTIDSNAAGGGYYHIKNSYGTSWGYNGYCFATFYAVNRHGYSAKQSYMTAYTGITSVVTQ